MVGQLDNTAELEDELHVALGSWAADHVRRYPGLEALPYDPAKYPSQRLDVPVTRTDFEHETALADDLQEVLRIGYESALALDASRVEASLSSLVPQLVESLERRESIVVLAAHADLLHDVGVIAGGIALGLREPELIRRNGTILNKVMSRETFAGVPIAELFHMFGNIYWAIPETANRDRWKIPSAAVDYLNTSSMRALLADMRRGLVLTIAPTGSASRRVSEDGGPESLYVPPISDATANLISRFDGYASAVFWEGRLLTTGLTRIPKGGSGDRRQHYLSLADSIMAEMGELISEASGLPISSVDA